MMTFVSIFVISCFNAWEDEPAASVCWILLCILADITAMIGQTIHV